MSRTDLVTMLILPEAESEVLAELTERVGCDVDARFATVETDDSLVDQWLVENPGTAVGERRVRTVSADLQEDPQWIAEIVVDIVAPYAAVEEKRLQSGESFDATPDAIPWSAHTALWQGKNR